MKRGFVLLLALSLLFLSGCGGSPASGGNSPPTATATSGEGGAAGAAITLKFCHADTEDTSYHKSFVEMSDAILEATDGYVYLEIYANGQLGGERDMVEGMQINTLDSCAISSAPIANFVEEFTLLDAPFLYRDDQHALDVVNGPVGEYLSGLLLEQQGIRVLTYYSIGYRHIFSNTPINSTDDLKGLKIRTMENNLHLATFEALGALPTPMAYSEVFTALQQKTIDAGENTFQNIINMKFSEVAPYIAKTGHFYCIKPVLISENSWQKIPAEYQDKILDAIAATQEQQWQDAIAENEACEQKLIEEGCTIVEFDVTDFEQVVSGVYGQFPSMLPADMVEAIRATR